MFKPHRVLGFGLWFIVLGFLGIPAVWKIRLYMLSGVFFILVFLLHLARETIFKLASDQAHSTDSFTQNGKERTGTIKEISHKVSP